MRARTVVLLVALMAGATAASGSVVLLYPVQDRTGDSRAAAALSAALYDQLYALGELVDAGRTRDSLRRLRLRNGDDATPTEIRRLREEIGADWLVATTLHDAERRQVPRVTISMRVYDARDGRLAWAGFRGSSGLDNRKLLGLGTITEVEPLLPVAVEPLVSDLLERLGGSGSPDEPRRRIRRADAGALAIVPFSGVTSRRALAVAETVTEAARAAALGAGLELAPRHCVDSVMREQRNRAWGGVDAELRRGLRNSCGATEVLTGAVERYDVGGGALEPEPLVAIALRLLDAETGRIVWTGAAERRGWERQGLLRLGRVYSRGELTERILRTLTARLLEERDA